MNASDITTPTPYVYRIEPIRIVDGDTVDARVDMGFGIERRKMRIRLLGIDTPEMRGVPEEEKVRARAARDALNQMLWDAAMQDRKVVLHSQSWDSFGRSLGTLFVEQHDGTWLNVSQWLIDTGHAVPYNP